RGWNTLSGICQRAEASIRVDGAEVAIPVPAAAQEHGISIIHQEMNLMPDLTVAQNIFTGREPRRGLMLDEAALNRKAAALLRDLGIDLDVRRKDADTNVAAPHMAET